MNAKKRPLFKFLTISAAALFFSTLNITQPASAACMMSNNPTDETAAGVCCVSSIDYQIVSSTNTRIPFKGIPTYRNGPGGTLNVTRSYEGTASYTISAGAKSEVGAVLAKAKLSVSASLTASNTTGVTNSFSHSITDGKFGNTQYVSYGKEVSYRKVRLNSNCSSTTLSAGKIKFPSTTEGWFYWESNS